MTPEEIQGHWKYSAGLLDFFELNALSHESLMDLCKYLYTKALEHGAKHEAEFNTSPEIERVRERLIRCDRERDTLVGQIRRLKHDVSL